MKYDADFFAQRWARESNGQDELAFTLNKMFSPASVLDVGCGFGSLVRWFVQSGVKANGIDISRYALERSPVQAYLRECDIEAERFPFPDSSFELVTCIGVLGYLSNPVAALKEIARVMNPQGHFVASLMFYDYLLMHPPKKEWVSLIEACGLKLKKENHQLIRSILPPKYSWIPFIEREAARRFTFLVFTK